MHHTVIVCVTQLEQTLRRHTAITHGHTLKQVQDRGVDVVLTGIDIGTVYINLRLYAEQ